MMSQLLWFICAFFINQTYAYIKFDSGDEIRFDFYYNNQRELFFCKNQATTYQTFTVNFAGTFERVPKLIFSTYFQNYATEGSNLPDEMYVTKVVTTTSFTTSITCPAIGRFYGFRFQWVAIDDDRIQVFEELNKIMTGQSSQVYTYALSNRNFNKAFVSVINLGINGALNVKYTINSVTTTSVNVQFTTTTTKLTRIGYHVVVAVTSAFTMEDIFVMPVYTQNTTTNAYHTGFIPVPADTVFIFPYAGIVYKCDVNFRQNRTVEISNSSGVQYMFSSCNDSIKFREQFIFGYTSTWIKKSINQVFTPFLCKKMKVSRVKKPDVTTAPQITVTISELNILLTQAYSQQLLLDQTQLTLNLQVVFQCSIGYKIQGNVTKCYNCDSTLWNLSQNCYSGANQITYSILLIQSTSVYQKIKVDVQPYSLTIAQEVINQKTETINVACLEIIRK